MPFYRKFQPIVLSPQMQRQANWAYRKDTGTNAFIDPALIQAIDQENTPKNDSQMGFRITPKISTDKLHKGRG